MTGMALQVSHNISFILSWWSVPIIFVNDIHNCRKHYQISGFHWSLAPKQFPMKGVHSAENLHFYHTEDLSVSHLTLRITL